MVTHTPDEIDFSTFPESDGQPMAETYPNVIQMMDLFLALRALFGLQGRAGMTTVGANQFVYYNRFNGRDNISPDVYVAFDRPPPGPSSWKTWVEDGFPDIVFEITSPSTQRNDLSDAPDGKRTRYARLGAKEYYIYDPQQGMTPSLLGFARRGGRMEPLPPLPGGGIVSPLLRTELRPVATAETGQRLAGTWLRVVDPSTGEPIPFVEEERRDLAMARGRLVETQEQLTETRERLTAESEARLEADQARLEAEDRAAQAEAALHALLADLARGRAPGSGASEG